MAIILVLIKQDYFREVNNMNYANIPLNKDTIDLLSDYIESDTDRQTVKEVQSIKHELAIDKMLQGKKL